MAIMKKMLFIINPRSGKEQIRSRLLEILDSFIKAGYGPSVYITQGPKDAEYQAARAKTKELVVCSGGDGTLNEVVSGLMTITPEKRPELGYIPSGSTNDFASSLGLPKNMRKAAQTAVLGKPFLVDVGIFGKKRIVVPVIRMRRGYVKIFVKRIFRLAAAYKLNNTFYRLFVRAFAARHHRNYLGVFVAGINCVRRRCKQIAVISVVLAVHIERYSGRRIKFVPYFIVL